MKKIKLFALAVCAMLSTNAFAQGTTSTGLFTISYDASDNATITGFRNDATAADVKDLVIPATLTKTGGDPYKVVAIAANAFTSNSTLLKAIETLVIEDENVATINASAFKGATALTSVTIGKAVETIDASAFEGCTALTTLNLEKAEALASIGNYAFGGTLIATYDFSKCAAMLDFDEKTPFVASAAGSKNNFTSKVVLHANTTDIDAAFSQMTILDDINLSGTKVANIVDGAFKGDVSLTALTFPETIKTIVGKPFVGCIRLATLEIPAAALTQVGGGSDNLYGTTSGAGKDYEDATGLANGLKALKTLKITGAVAATCALKANAFTTCTALKTVEIGKGKTVDPKIFEAGFATVCDEAAVTLGDITGNDFGAADFLAAPADGAGVKGVTLTIEKISVAIANEIMSGKVATTVSGAISKAVTLDALGKTATSLTFGGNITAAFVKYTATNAKLTSINFGTVELVASTIPTAFNGVSQATALTITWTPADAKAVKFAAVDAFAGAAVGAANGKVSLSVTQAVAALYAYDEANLYNVKTFGAAPDSENVELTPANGVEGATTYFAKFYAAVGYKIAKTNGTATVKVYEAYVDDKDATIYMLPMSAINGYFFIGAGNPVIVKSTSTDKITAETLAATDAANDGMSDNYDSGGNPKNQIKRTATAMTGASIMTDLDKTYYAMAKPEKYGLSWKTFKTSTQMPANTFYITTKESSASRLNVVWLDEDATAIQGFKAKVEAGQIYNLRGEKVNASYKGIVIKDGKKYIQK